MLVSHFLSDFLTYTYLVSLNVIKWMVVPPPSSPCAWCLPWSQGALPVGFCLGLRCGAVGRSRGHGRGAGWRKPMGGWKKRHFWLKASDITTLCPCETQFKGPTRKESRDTCVSVFPSSHNNTTHSDISHDPSCNTLTPPIQIMVANIQRPSDFPVKPLWMGAVAIKVLIEQVWADAKRSVERDDWVRYVAVGP